MSAIGIACTACIYIGQWSYHFNRSREWHERNNALGVEYHNTFVLAFTNSYGDESFALGYRAAVTRGRLQLGAKIGAVEGYGNNLRWWSGGAVAPFILPDASYWFSERVALDVNLLPGEFISVGFKVKL